MPWSTVRNSMVIKFKSKVPNRLLNPLFICACCAVALCSAAAWCKCVPPFLCRPILWPGDYCMNFHLDTEDCQRTRTLGQTNINKQCIIQLKSTVPKSVKRLLNPLFIRACCAAACCSAAAWCKCVPPFSWRPAASIEATLVPRPKSLVKQTSTNYIYHPAKINSS